MPVKCVVLLLTEGAEETEVVIVMDLLRQADILVTVAGLFDANPVKCAHGTVIVPDSTLSTVLNDVYDAVVLPGCRPENDALFNGVGQLLAKQNETGRLIAATSTGQMALMAYEIPANIITSHISVRKVLEAGGYKYSEDRVVVDGNIVTSQGPGTAFEFALTLVELLVGKTVANKLMRPMIIRCPNCSQ